MKVKTITAFIIILIFLVIVFQNAEQTEIRLLFWSLSVSKILLLLLTAFLGFLIGLIVSRSHPSGKKKTEKQEPDTERK
ncbi:MAG TPA: DUF1049 domain-containing protein [bacterium]|nr:DUF1049 domain-containing protein [bacterium]